MNNLTEFKNLLQNEIDEATKELHSQLEIYQKDNEKLEAQVDGLKNKITQLEKEQNLNDFALNVIKNIKIKVDDRKNNTVSDYSKMDFRQYLIYMFDYIYPVDFVEDFDCNAPIWIILLTRYYSHKDDIIKWIEYLELANDTILNKLPNFTMPFEWGKAELDSWFNLLPQRSMINCCYFRENIKFWSDYALETPLKQCEDNYSNIPYQFILRNPLFITDKYFNKICEGVSKVKDSYFIFYHLDRYNDLSKEQINKLASVGQSVGCNGNDYNDFIKRNLNIITDTDVLDRFYSRFKGKYGFVEYLYKMPERYALKYIESPAFCKYDDMISLAKHFEFDSKDIYKVMVKRMNEELGVEE